ncbi:DUF6544 family protein [Heliobacterium mobile]|uniref:DUF6544 family protein n=1 Tax=Heliobacterium mobile TaxID=28064 RepID=UPI001A9BCD43|nr:DUF6544 family protein [Heliobacterium mobile]
MTKVALSVIAITIVLVFTVALVAKYLFNQMVIDEVRDLLKGKKEHTNEIIRQEDVAELPLPVRKWLERSKVVGRVPVRTVRLEQKGFLRTKADQPWMPMQAEQYISTDEPGFVWKANIQTAPLLYLVGKDKYQNGKGSMLIKFLALVPVVDSKGPEIDQGTLLRYLGECIWVPSAVLSEYITWEEVDMNSAKATMSYGGVTASGTFTFDEKGDVIQFSARRYMESSGEYRLEDWVCVVKGYQEFQGIRVPIQCSIIWKLNSGDFEWFQLEVTDIEYDQGFVEP